MKINKPAGTTVWRDLAAGLTADQFAHVKRMGEIYSPFTADETAAALLRQTREFIRENRRGYR